jgi:hypothetical protein
MTEAGVAVASFLGGCLITALGFILGFVGRLTKVEAVCKDIPKVVQLIADVAVISSNITDLKTDMAEIRKKSAIMCPVHQEVLKNINNVEKDVAVIKAQAK